MGRIQAREERDGRKKRERGKPGDGGRVSRRDSCEDFGGQPPLPLPHPATRAFLTLDL
jgi:hypothetical protein